MAEAQSGQQTAAMDVELAVVEDEIHLEEEKEHLQAGPEHRVEVEPGAVQTLARLHYIVLEVFRAVHR